jgi:serine/threonine-protein kinase
LTPERWRRIEELFESMVELEGAERATALAAACAEDEPLRGEVESLLAAHERAGSFLDRPALVRPPPSAPEPRPGPAVGQRAGAYVLVRELGHGGGGRVFLAERADREYEGRVAVKVLNAPLASPQLLERFRRERQILADLDHPNIARLLDSGTLPEGLPYLVMEYVEGTPIDEYCDRRRLGIEERLRLFQHVCRAVQYAHRNLIVHRDLKPGNVLVTEDGTPKLLDFGIAKLLEPGDAAEAQVTRTWHRALTPRYASPEQVEGAPVTTATDVYSLGVLLYELLTGRSPYGLEKDAPLPRVLESVTAREPVTPSQVAAGEEVARRRSLSPRQLRRRLEGDLDNILLEALRKDPARRCASAEALAEDLRRHLENLPVLARREALLYRASKFVRRNRLATALASVLLLLVLGFGVAAMLQARRIASERDKAEEALAFLVEVFRSSDPLSRPAEPGARERTAREVLDRGAERVERELSHRPLLQATLLDAIGEVYRSLAHYDRAQPLLTKALELRRSGLPAGHPEIADSLTHLAELHLARAELEPAEALFREALEARVRRHGREDPRTAAALEGLGRTLHRAQRLEEAEEALREALDTARRTLGGDHAQVGETLVSLAELRSDRGDLREAEELTREALSVQLAALGASHPRVAQARENLAVFLQNRGELEQAEEHLREAAEVWRAVLDEEHPIYLASLNNLATLLQEQGRGQEAESLSREVLAVRVRGLPPGHPQLLMSRNNLATILLDLGGAEEAEALYRENLAAARAAFGERHLFVAGTHHQIGFALRSQGRLEEAEAQQRRSLELALELYGEDHDLTARAVFELGRVACTRGRFAEGERDLRRALEIRRRILPAGHPRLPEAEAQLGACLARAGRHAEAEELLLSALQGYPEDASRAGRWRLEVLEDLVALYRETGRARAADRYAAELERARERVDQPPAPADPSPVSDR